jgi:multidrug efflux system outer membrane protein
VFQQTRADVANYTTLVAQDMNALELLVGGRIDEALLPDGINDAQNGLGSVKAGLDSSILLERPDIKAAEHILLSANANIGAARAAFFPKISLTASAGFMSDALSSLFDSGVWSVGGSLVQTIFDGGKKTADLDYAWARYEGYLARYEQTIQSAFRETSDALARRGTIEEQLSAHMELTRISQESYKLAEARYSAGVDNYLNVLTSQRTLYSSELALTNTRLTELSNRITLYRVMGGGI